MNLPPMWTTQDLLRQLRSREEDIAALEAQRDELAAVIEPLLYDGSQAYVDRVRKEAKAALAKVPKK